MIVKRVDEQAVKAAVARMVVHQDTHPELVALGVSGAVESMKLSVGHLGTQSNLQRYAGGVARSGERQANRKWGSYPSGVARLADRIIKRAHREIDATIG